MSEAAAPDVPGPSEEELRVLRQYKTWKKHAAYFYDFFLSTSIPWPSLTVQWFPDVETSNDEKNGRSNWVKRVLLGTQTCGNGDEFVRIAQIDHSWSTQPPDLKKYDADLGEVGEYSNTGTKGQITHKINHSCGEVNRARYMPQNPDLIATMASNGRCYIFDRTKHPSDPTQNFKPDIVLDYHQKQGFGLSWNSHKRGHLLTSAEDGKIAHWDVVGAFKKDDRVISPTMIYSCHNDVVNDVKWHSINENLFGSVSDDQTIQINDIREDPSKSPSNIISNDQAEICLQFNPVNENLLATAGESQSVSLWDIRKPQQKIYEFTNAHTAPIVELDWSPFHSTIFCTASEDHTVNIWDASLIDSSSSKNALIFKHGGHTAPVNSVNWDPSTPWTLASVAGDNSLQIWKVADTLVG